MPPFRVGTTRLVVTMLRDRPSAFSCMSIHVGFSLAATLRSGLDMRHPETETSHPGRRRRETTRDEQHTKQGPCLIDRDVRFTGQYQELGLWSSRPNGASKPQRTRHSISPRWALDASDERARLRSHPRPFCARQERRRCKKRCTRCTRPRGRSGCRCSHCEQQNSGVGKKLGRRFSTGRCEDYVQIRNGVVPLRAGTRGPHDLRALQ